MSDSQDQHAAEIVRKANEIINEARRHLAASDEFYRQQGLDPEKVRVTLEGVMGPKQREEVDALIRADLDAVEQDVLESTGHGKSSQSISASSKRPRSLI